MRVFIGIPLSVELVAKAAAYERRHIDLPVRWIPAENLHVTLIPPWEENQVDKILNEISKAEGKRFSMQFSRITLGPSASGPRLIWASGKEPAEILSLQQSLHQALLLPPAHRQFKLHATLARFKPEDFALFPIGQTEESVEWEQEAEEFVLYESSLTARGSVYKKLASFPLQ